MNYFSTQRITTWTIVILIILNLSTLAMLWFSRFIRPATPLPGEGSGNVAHFLYQELDLTDDQARQFDELRRQHFQESKVLVEASQQLKRELFEEVFASSPDTEKLQGIAEEIGAKQAELETLRFTHFLELKSLCQPEQSEKFQALFREIYPPQNPPDPGRSPQPAEPPRSGSPPPQPPEEGRPGQSPQPPQEAINACQGKNQGDSCQFAGLQRTVTGTCRNIDRQLVCVPKRESPAGPPPGQQRRP